MLLVTLGAAGADALAPYNPTAQALRDRLQPPTPLGPHVFGTDNLGRDVLSRTIYGARVSLTVGIAAAALAGSLGVLLGLLAGYLGGWWDTLISRLADVQQAIPFLILAIAVAVIVGPSLTNVVLVLAVTTWVSYFRVVRAEVLSVRESLLVDAARFELLYDPALGPHDCGLFVKAEHATLVDHWAERRQKLPGLDESFGNGAMEIRTAGSTGRYGDWQLIEVEWRRRAEL